MKYRYTHSRLAGAAIAAVLAFGSTPSFAQEAGTAQGAPAAAPPVVMVPPVSASPAPIPAPAPAVTAPAQDPQLLTRLAPEPPTNVRADPAPRAERAPVRAERAPVARSERLPAAAAPAAAATPAAAPAPVTPAADAEIAMTPADTMPIDAYEPVAATEPAMAEPPVPVREGNDFAAILAALLAVAVAGVGGFLVMGAMRRRRHRMADMEEPVRYEVRREPGPPRRRLSDTLRSEEAVAPPMAGVEPVSRPHMPSAATLAAAGKQETPKPFVATRLAPKLLEPLASSLPSTVNSVSNITPASVPTDPEEREELIQQMVEAEPDRVNPFQSRKARRKRARLILQSLHRRFEDARPNFDIAKFRRDWNIAPPRGFAPA